VAASELFAALPKEYREQLHDLPEIVAALEARAAEARAEMEVVAALVPSESGGAEVLAARKKAAADHLAESVAALESIRLDLLRLQMGRVGIESVTASLAAAQRIGEQIVFAAEARDEVERLLVEGSAPLFPPARDGHEARRSEVGRPTDDAQDDDEADTPIGGVPATTG
jgi:serine/threonine-protein kinase